MAYTSEVWGMNITQLALEVQKNIDELDPFNQLGGVPDPMSDSGQVVGNDEASMAKLRVSFSELMGRIV